MYGFYEISKKAINVKDWKEIAPIVCKVKEVTISKKCWVQEAHQEIETSITINNPTDIGFLQEPVEFRGGLGNEILSRNNISFDELFRKDVIFRMVCCTEKGFEFIITNKPCMNS